LLPKNQVLRIFQNGLNHRDQRIEIYPKSAEKKKSTTFAEKNGFSWTLFTPFSCENAPKSHTFGQETNNVGWLKAGLSIYAHST
jgi:hypothetical protein